MLDENIIILAAKMENEKGEPDLTCLQLLLDIIKKCHTMICSDNLLKRYLRILSNLQGKHQSSVPKLLHMAMGKGKIQLINYLPELSNENRIPPDDVEIVRLANHAKAILVTTDSRLKEAVERLPYNIDVLTPHETYEFVQLLDC